ncbi:GTP-binding protein At3g49725, chloroplastic, partial [Linum grandiflorum]
AELAALMYMKSRLVRVRSADGRFAFGASGEAEVVSARGSISCVMFYRRGSGGQRFMSGAGETELHHQRRRRSRLLSQIAEVHRTRGLHRAALKRRGAVEYQLLTNVVVVGYTNIGKSTLVSALSNSCLYSDSMYSYALKRKVLLSDTNGFISDLPVQAELAALMYMKSRLVRVRSADGRFAFGASGEAEVVSARGSISCVMFYRRGSRGQRFMSGAGETELHLQRRRRSRLLSQIAEVHRTRGLHRAALKRRGAVENQPLTNVVVVGYTNIVGVHD